MPRFVLLRHDCPPGYERPSHWDLMLEVEATGVLRTWALVRLPVEWERVLQSPTSRHDQERNVHTDQRRSPGPPETVIAEMLGDHRLAYLDYEGPLTGDRGEVRRVECGTYQELAGSATSWEFQLTGGRLRGRLRFEQEQDVQRRWRVSWKGEDT